MTANRRHHRGFTLVEILLAVALLGAVLLALNVFVFSMAEIWGRSADRRLFDQHVRAVTRHVDGLFRHARLGSPGARGAPVLPTEVRDDRGGTLPLLTFELPAGDRLLPWPEQPLPDVVCSLAAEPGRGLVLYWRSRLELRAEDTPPRTLLLTPFVHSVSYDYYLPETGRWLHESQPLNKGRGDWRVPDCVTLNFVHGDLTATARVVLPVETDALPAF